MRKSKSLGSIGKMPSIALLAALSVFGNASFAQQDQAEAQKQELQRQLELQQRQLEVQQRLQQRRIARGNVAFGVNAVTPTDSDAKATGVFVRDSAVAGEKLALAERMERLKEWDTSAEVYQEVLDGYADRVLPIHNDEKGQPDRYGSVNSVVQDRLAAWPEEGRNAYLARYELPARRLLEGADSSNRTELMKVVNRYFLTTAGRDASLLLIESYFDHAEFIAAAMLADRLLEKHPQISEQSPLLLARSALSWHLAGDSARASKQAAQLKDRFSTATDTIGGKTRTLTEVVQAALQVPRHAMGSSPANSWAMPFGSNDRAALAKETVESGTPRIWAKLESISLQSAQRTGAPGEAELDVQHLFARQRELGASTGILPSVDGSQMFFQDNANIYAYDLERGEPLAGWLVTYNATGRFSYGTAVSTPRGVQMTTTLTDRHVLAILGQSEMINFGTPEVATAVVCLDRVTGKQAWRFALGAHVTDDEALRSARPVGSVLVAGDSVYFVAHNRRPGAFEDSYLLCLSLEDGTVRWTRHLASGNASRIYYDYNIPPQNPGDSHLAYANGSIYVCTDLGAIANVNAADGTLAWLSVYPHPLPANPQNQWAAINMGQAPKVTPAYVGNPVIVSDGMIITLPGDAESLFVHDAATGELRGSVKMERLPGSEPTIETSEKYEVLVGLTGKRLVVSGSRSVAILDLEKIVGEPGKPGEPAFNDVVVRNRSFMRTDIDDTIRGRPFITDKSIYVPTAWKMFRLTADGSKALEMYPPAPQDSWENRPEEGPGNLVFAGDSLIVAGPDRINVYADLSLLRHRMEAAVASDVRSITPRLRYADALFNAGQIADAIHWLDAAIEGLTNNGLITPGPDRDRVFELSMAMFRRLSSQDRTEPQQAAILERLARTADTPPQQVALQLSIASYSRRTKSNADAVEAYQKLIDEANLGAIVIRGPEESTSASDFATEQIDALIKADSAEVYARVEAKAAAALASAQASGEASQLLSVLASYPNSRAGKDAVNLALQICTTSDVASIDLLRRVGATPLDATQKVQLYHALLRGDLARGEIQSALGRARRIASLDPNHALGSLSLSGAGGATLGGASPADVVASLQKLSYEAEDRALANLNPPVQEPILDFPRAVHLKGISSLLVPSSPRLDRVAALSSNRRSVQIFEAGKTTPLQTIQMAQRDVTDSTLAIWRGDDLLLVAQQLLSVLDTKQGAVRWSFNPADLKPLSDTQASTISIDEQGLVTPVTSQPKRPAVVMNPTARRQGIVINRLNQQQVIRQFADGEQVAAWEADDPAQPGRETIAYTRAFKEMVVVITTAGRVIGLDPSSGEVRWQSAFGNRRPSSVAVYDDLIAVSGNSESASRLTVYRVKDGSQVINESYSGPVQRRLNTIQVSREGYLAAVHADYFDVFDLGSGDSTPIATFDGQAKFQFQATRSQERVQFCADKLLIMLNSPGQPQNVLMFDTLTAKPTTDFDPKTKQQAERQFIPATPDGIRNNGPSAQMYVQKDRLLLRYGRDFSVYLVAGADRNPWKRQRDKATAKLEMGTQSPLFVRDGILIFNLSAQPGQPSSSPLVQYLKRELLPDGREIGTVLAEFKLERDNAKMLDRVQAVDGGLYTVWTDGVMSFYPTRKE